MANGFESFDDHGRLKVIGTVGPIGPTGPPGATGPTGPTGPGVALIPLVDGSEPPNFITDGDGNLILVPAS